MPALALTNLKIIPFVSPEAVKSGGLGVGLPLPPFICPVNPETFAVQTAFEHVCTTGTNTQQAGGRYVGMQPRTFSFDIFLDGTGALPGPKIDVVAYIKLWKVLTAFRPAIHRPGYFVVQYGDFLARCYLKEYTITYKMFRSNGLPLRAVISTSWAEFVPDDLFSKALNLMSPDVTHAHQVKGGETLPNIAAAVYRDPQRYYDVAVANELDTIRHLDPGRTLLVPPIAR